MLYTIENQYLKVSIDSKGAQLWSVQDKEGCEYLWQGDNKYWGDRAINLFPYIARLTQGKYKLHGQEYFMDIHGFLKDCELEAIPQEEDRVVFILEDSETTRQQYPYRFRLTIDYSLRDEQLYIKFKILNKEDARMYFGIGGHPGFQVPLESGLAFEDYYLDFGEEAEPKRVGMSEDCFVTGLDIPFILENNRILPLRHTLFDDDAIILKDMSKEVSLKSEKGKKGLTVSFPDMAYLGIWHMPHTDAPYVCIEPWTSLPSRKGVIEELSVQENLVSLNPGETYENTWSIKLNF